MEKVINLSIFIKLFLVSLIPILVSVGIFLLKKKTSFGELPYGDSQFVIGLIFGVVAICGTEFGVDVGGATANVRDAAPLCAGLIFGAPAGVIAGLIGGLERWFATYWGAGAYSQIACSVSTVLAGLFAAFLRKGLFNDKRPTASIGFVTGIVMEVIHLTILFLTHLSGAAQAFEIVQICTLPMLLSNAFSVAIAVFVVAALEFGLQREKEKPKISQKVQVILLLAVILAYFITTGFVYALQTYSDLSDADNLMTVGIEDAQSEIRAAESDDTIPLLHRHLGDSGTVYVADAQQVILNADDSAAGKTLKDVGIDLNEVKTMRTRFTVKVSGEKYYCMVDRQGDYVIAAMLTEEEVFANRTKSAYVNSFMEILVFAGLFILIYYLIDRLVVRNIESVNESLYRITDGDLDTVVEVRSSSEFSFLSDRINTTVSALKRYIHEAETRIDRELRFARNIQYETLPTEAPETECVELYAFMDTAKEVGGDFYDYYMLDANRIVFLIADVSGKGIPAALFMMKAKTMLKNFTETDLPLNEVFTRANNGLCEGNEEGMFVTAWMGILNLVTGEMEFVNAGHNPPLLYRKGESFAYLRTRPGFVLAGMEGLKYRSQTLQLNPGDKLFLYTDGVTEAADPENALFGEERLSRFLNAYTGAAPKTMIEEVNGALERFADGAEQADDITMLMLEYIEAPAEDIENKYFLEEDNA